MNTSAIWINDYLDPPCPPEEQAELLTRAGFPLEGAEDVPISSGTDTRQDFEMTSNRGDCTCHVGLAREIAALSGRSLNVPVAAPNPSGPPAADLVKVTNREPDRCPLYTARIIRGVKVGPSPDWLKDRLTARGDIPRNNIVDATNFVLFELGQPTHVFDLATLKGAEIIIRMAQKNEPFLPIGEGAAEVKLIAEDLVIADAERAVAMAGVKGGALTAVTESTTDILIEAASFDPVTVRKTSRRHNIASDSSYRFERGVHPGQVNAAADRLAALILELAGGALCEGVVSDGKRIPEPRTVTMRCERCRQILGVDIDDDHMAGMLARLGFQTSLDRGAIRCTVPIVRLDIEREVDLIEEIGRMYGHDKIPIAETISVRVAPAQPEVQAKCAVDDALVGMGYLETVTHSLVSDVAAGHFLPPGMQMLRVDDERAKAEPTLRPSILPSLLRVLALNYDRGVENVQFFETAATYARENGRHIEHVNLALVHSDDDEQTGMRRMRGVIDRVCEIIFGPGASVVVEATDRLPWLEPGAAVQVNGDMLGTFGPLSKRVLKSFDVEGPVIAAEVGLPQHYERYPPETMAEALPSYPSIERDISAILDEPIPWAKVHRLVRDLNLEHLERIAFVTTFRGKPIPPGKKSLTLRLRFRAPDRTLKHDEVDEQMADVMRAIEHRLGGEIRK